MERVKRLDLKIFYVWLLLEKVIKNPEDSFIRQKLISLLNCETPLETKCYETVAFYWYYNFSEIFVKRMKLNLTSGIEFSQESLKQLDMLKIVLEQQFYVQVNELEKNTYCMEFINNTFSKLYELNKASIPDDTRKFINVLIALCEYFKHSTPENELEMYPEFDKYCVYLLVKAYSRLLIYAEISNNYYPDINKYFEFYSELIQKPVTPIIFISKEEHIRVEPALFPDEIHIKIFELMSLELPEFASPFIISNIGREIINNSLFTTLMSHHLGHLLDRSVLHLEQTITSNLLIAHPDFYIALDKEQLQWIKEIIADAFAVCLMGPAYFCALLDHLRDVKYMEASSCCPGIAYRTSIMHNYLLQNDFFNLMTPKAFEEIQQKIQHYEDCYKTKEESFIEFENILNLYINQIYFVIMDFLQNAGIYSSYDLLSEVICTNEGNINKAEEFLSTSRQDFKAYINLQNIRWLIKLSD
ncbi:MAG: hypothetical protein AB1782_00965 [Cyanobacteriota bacterium]